MATTPRRSAQDRRKGGENRRSRFGWTISGISPKLAIPRHNIKFPRTSRICSLIHSQAGFCSWSLRPHTEDVDGFPTGTSTRSHFVPTDFRSRVELWNSLHQPRTTTVRRAKIFQEFSTRGTARPRYNIDRQPFRMPPTLHNHGSMGGVPVEATSRIEFILDQEGMAQEFEPKYATSGYVRHVAGPAPRGLQENDVLLIWRYIS